MIDAVARRNLRLCAVLLIGVLALTGSGCGGKKKKKAEDPVATAAQDPGVRKVVIPKQRNDVRVVVTPCSVAAVQQAGAKRKPPGSNEIIVPKGTLTQTVGVPPCPEKPMEAAANTILMTPGGAGVQGGGPSEMPQNELVLPTNSNVRTVIIPPCTMMPEGGEKKKPKTLALPAIKTDQKTVTAPPCVAPPPTKKK